MKTEKTNEVFTAAQRKVIEDDLKKDGASQRDIDRFILLCETTRLNPVTRQVYARMQRASKEQPDGTYAWEKTLVVITSIDGLRAIAESTGEYIGQQGPFWCNKDGAWKDVWIAVDKGGPYAAKVGVVRKGFPEPVWGVARYESFVQVVGKGEQRAPNAFWKRMPDLMTAKCAEAGAIRRAFPQLLAGLYIEEEISDNHDNEPLPEPAPTPGKPVAPIQQAPQQPAAAPEPEPAPEPPKKPAKAEKSAKKAEPAPEPPKPEENPVAAPETQAGYGWEGYVICQISVERFKGKRLGDLSAEDFSLLKRNWVDKNADKFATHPGKKHEADMILEGYKHHLAKESGE